MPSKRCLELRGTIFVSQREPKHGQRVRHNQSSPLPPVQTELGQWLRIGHYLSMRYCPRVRRRNCRCGISQIANRPNAIVISSAPAGVVGRLLATSPAAHNSSLLMSAMGQSRRTNPSGQFARCLLCPESGQASDQITQSADAAMQKGSSLVANGAFSL